MPGEDKGKVYKSSKRILLSKILSNFFPYSKAQYRMLIIHEVVGSGKRLFESLLSLVNTINHVETMITFDDGFKCLYDHVFPLLEKLKIPSTIFLTTGYIDSQDTIWPDKLASLIKNTDIKKIVVDGKEICCDKAKYGNAGVERCENDFFIERIYLK